LDLTKGRTTVATSIQIFLSAVTAEFGSYRNVLRHDLDRPNVSVKVQEDFITTGHETLEKLDHYIQRCAAVVHLVGNMTGAMAPEVSVNFLLRRYPDFTQRLPVLGPFLQLHGPLLSYTQWEAWLAIYHRKELIVAVPEDGAARDAGYQLDEMQRIAQQDHLKRLASLNRHPVAFRNSDRLAIELLRSSLHDILLNAGVGQLPVASIDSTTLREICNKRLQQRIAEVSQRKYLPDLYVQRRAVQSELERFIDAPARYRTEASTIFEQLETIRAHFPQLSVQATKLKELRDGMLAATSPERAQSQLQILKHLFLFSEVEAVEAAVYDVLTTRDWSHAESRLEHFLRSLRRLPYIRRSDAALAKEALEEEWRRSLARSQTSDRPALEGARKLLPSVKVGDRLTLANDLIKRLKLQLETLGQPCLALVDRAGRGKTNVLLNAASVLARTFPTLVFGGHGIPASFRGVETLVQEELDRDAPGQFLSWLPRAALGLQAEGAWMYILIDGINEALDQLELARQLSEFLARIQGARIRLILSCRDIFWESFAHSLGPYLFEASPLRLSDFDARESTDAIRSYLDSYEIRVELGEDARRALSHPLLLRLFCEAYRGQTLGKIDSLRTVAVFDQYVKVSTRQVADRLQWVDPTPVTHQLLSIAGQIWQRQQPVVELESLSLSIRDAASVASIYVNLQNEGLLRATGTASGASHGSVGFVYDELLEYCLALHWIERARASVSQGAALASIVEEAAGCISTFPYGAGALLHLDRLLEKNGRLLNELLARVAELDDEVLILRQYILLQVFERTCIVALDDRVLALLVRFEQHSTADIKERIGALVVEIQRQWPDHPRVLLLVSRCLELEAPVDPVEGPHCDFSNAGVLDGKDSIGKDGEEPPARLPVARHHYSIETRLNAIGLLIRGSDTDRGRARLAMERLGRMDLSSALRAVQAFNMAPDEAVISQISSYLAERAPEYKLYSAWLLKKRQGPRPAEILVKLLLDPNGRVREFTKRLLRTRSMEIELINALLERVRDPEVVSLNDQINLIDALGAGAMRHASTDSNCVAEVVDLLIERLNHANVAVRLQAGRTLFSWRAALQQNHLEHLRKQPDVVVRRLVHLLTRIELSH
jgi:hypothetical protein